MKICKVNPNLVKIGQKYQTLHEDPSVFHVVGSDICKTTINRTHCCVSMAMLSIFIILLTATYMSTIQREHTVAFP
jgi:hypothetical protein